MRRRKQKNCSPGHPQTQGGVERFHQTQKRYLAARTLPELQKQLDQLREHYNENRPHRARDRSTPANASSPSPTTPPSPSSTSTPAT
ncbi:integrase core domain-containing protein [Tsukamurella soli]|uniref:Integrase catalytic domain-containing protein n=1 Tax=Tsukamurella soli TaxID=644556 RepID=A0ABP8J012_9ACTN